MGENIETLNAELSILETIYSSQDSRTTQVSQRDLADSSGLSLGMVNTLIRRFTEKGWITVRKINSRNLSYAMTPDGVKEIARRTYHYFSRTARTVSLYKELIESFIMGKKSTGIKCVVFSGISELDFVFEYACQRHGILFLRSASLERALKLEKPDSIIIRADATEPESFDGPGIPLVSIIGG